MNYNQSLENTRKLKAETPKKENLGVGLGELMVIGWNIMGEKIFKKITKGAGQKIFINHRKDIF